MKFEEHYALVGKHAFLSASNYHWINYSLEKLVKTYTRSKAIAKGTELHSFAQRCIELGIKLPRSRKSLNHYVNDAIGYRMKAEQILFYSANCFGTADSISFRNNLLRIHDLKTGKTRSSMSQLEVYTSLFCLEYKYQPAKIDIELRIYQNDEVIVHEPNPLALRDIMDKIIIFDKKINEINLVMEDAS